MKCSVRQFSAPREVRLTPTWAAGVIKQRLARKGEGRSGGFRSIILFRSGDKAFFVYGFPKSGRDDIRRNELQAFRKLAGEMLGLDDRALTAAKTNGTITEVSCYGKAAV